METINHECYVSLEVVKLLKEAGFDWKCKYAYIITPDGDMPTGEEGMLIEYVENVNWLVSAPTLDVAQRWLREVKNIYVQLDMHMPSPTDYGYAYALMIKVKRKGLDKGEEIEYNSLDCLDCETSYSTYESALEAGIKKALEIILEKKE